MMVLRIRCPRCNGYLDPITGYCGGSQCIPPKYSVWRPQTVEFEKRLKLHSSAFQRFRDEKGMRITNPASYPNLPFGLAGKFWNQLQNDLRFIRRMLKGRQGLHILNFGSWNGWLSNQLAAWGHEVVAIGYFLDPYDGLGAKQFFPNHWCCVQMDIEDISIIESTFDVIIVNRCISFLSSPHEVFHNLQGLLRSNGMLVITGMHFYADAKLRKQFLQKEKARIRQQYNFELFLKPTKGYLDLDDFNQFSSQGVTLLPASWKERGKRMISTYIPKQPISYFGIWRKDAPR